LRLELPAPSGKAARFEAKAAADGAVRLLYTLAEPCPAYGEYRGTLTLLDDKGTAVASTPLWLATWTTPIDLDLGGLYLRPGDKQLVRLNLGLSRASLAKLNHVRLEVVRRGTGMILKTQDGSASPAATAAPRDRLPADPRE